MLTIGGISPRTSVKPFMVAAQTINVPCVDLVRAIQTGKSIDNLATEKHVQQQALIDALTKAYLAALTKDVEQNIITKTDADKEQIQIVEWIPTFLSSTLTL